jgi:hypothetical protein
MRYSNNPYFYQISIVSTRGGCLNCQFLSLQLRWSRDMASKIEAGALPITASDALLCRPAATT